jgi:hypothetical protein
MPEFRLHTPTPVEISTKSGKRSSSSQQAPVDPVLLPGESHADSGGVVVAVDPGASGAIVILGGSTPVPITMALPRHEGEVWQVFSRLGRQYMQARFYVEVVSGWAGKDRYGAPGSHMFNFGAGYGMTRMAVLAATGTPAVRVRPQTWQAALGVEPRRWRRRGRKKQWLETQVEFKRRLKLMAVEFFPEVKVTLANCDALLIALYAQRYARMLK